MYQPPTEQREAEQERTDTKTALHITFSYRPRQGSQETN